MKTAGEGSLSAAQAQSVIAPSEPWLSCDDCFEQVDGYIEDLVHHREVLNEPLRVHLARCPACFDEAETLIELVAGDEGQDVEELLGTFHAEVTRPVGSRAAEP